MNIMSYFDDIEFIGADAQARCLAQLDRSFPQSYSFEFLRSGRMRHSVNGSPSVVIERPCVFWHHPSCRYSYGAVDSSGWDHHWVLMRGERPRRMLEESLMKEFPCGYAFIREPELFDAEFHALIELALSPGGSRFGEAAAALERALSLALKLASPGPEGLAACGPFDGILETMKLNPLKDYDFAALASSCGMSYGHFRRRFRELSGMAPKEHLLHLRMRLAARMLQERGRQVKDVALATGYRDPAQFTKMFKSRLGVSPEEYRRCLPS